MRAIGINARRYTRSLVKFVDTISLVTLEKILPALQLRPSASFFRTLLHDKTVILFGYLHACALDSVLPGQGSRRHEADI